MYSAHVSLSIEHLPVDSLQVESPPSLLSFLVAIFSYTMESYTEALTAVCAPLVVVQGLSPAQRPAASVLVRRTGSQSPSSRPQESPSSFGVQLDIHRELDPVATPVVNELVAQLEAINTRGRLWWPQASSQTSSQSQSETSPWFNVLYADAHYDLAVNGSQSPLSPYLRSGRFANTLVPLEWMSKYYDRVPVAFVSLYELGQEEYDSVLVNEVLRMKHQLEGTLTKFYCLIYTDGPVGEERSAKIRAKTEMGDSNALFFVTNVQSETTAKDRALFVSKLLLVLKRHATDFFNAQIRKLKVREAKEGTYPEALFTTRFLIKFSLFELSKGVSEYSTNLVARTHSKLMALLAGSLDKQTTEQVRAWSEVFTLHAIRAHILLGSFDKAYQRLRNNVNLTNKSCGFDLSWTSNQFVVFAQLLECMGPDLVPLDYALLPGDGAGTGGRTPHPGFIYLEALRYREMAMGRKESHGDDNRLLLLQGALDMFSKARQAKFNRFECMVYVKLGDVYLSQGNYSMALNNFKAALGVYRHWPLVRANLVPKLVECCKQLGQWDQARRGICLLLAIPQSTLDKLYGNGATDKWKAKVEELKQGIEFVDPISIENNLINMECIVKQRQIEVGQSVQVQMKLTSLSLPLVEELRLTQLVIDIQGGESVKLVAGDGPTGVHRLIGTGPHTVNLDITPSIIVQLTQRILDKGQFSVIGVHAEGELNGISFTTAIIPTYPEYGFWVTEEEDAPLERVLNGGPVVNVTPREPKVTCSLHCDEVGYNGQLFPITLRFRNDDDLSDVKIHASGFGTVQGPSELKDVVLEFDEGREFRSGVLGRGKTLEVVAHVALPQLAGMPYDKRNSNCTLRVQLKYLDGGSLTETEREIRVCIVDLFKIQSRVFPLAGVEDPKGWRFAVDVTNVGYAEIVLRGLNLRVKSLPEADVTYSTEAPCTTPLAYKASSVLGVKMEVSSATNLRSIPLELTGEIEYTAPWGQGTYTITIFNGRLPHCESRVLADFQPPTMTYTIENPTDELVQFQTNMTNDNGGVALLEKYPKTTILRVDPHSSHTVKFLYRVDKGVHILPEYTLFDGHQFKKILTINESLVWRGGKLYWGGEGTSPPVGSP